MGGSHVCIKRRTKKNAATIGVSLVVLGPLWGPIWPWLCNMPILDVDEEGEKKKPFNMRIFLWNGHILAS